MEKRMDQAVKKMLTQEQILRYLDLVDRRLQIIVNSGVNWRPEYAQELEEIDKEIAELRVLVDTALDAKAASEQPAAADGAVDAGTAEVSDPADPADPADDSCCTDAVPCGSSEDDLDRKSKEVVYAHCKSCQYYLETGNCDLDCSLDLQHLKEEIRQAYLNGGRTPYLCDIDGNEYYTTTDGVRHYTRVEG